MIVAVKGQIDDLYGEIRERVAKRSGCCYNPYQADGRSLTDYLRELGLKVRYLHSEINTLERMKLSAICGCVFDVLVGINLLREGLTCRKYVGGHSDADKEGFLRRKRSLIKPSAGRQEI